MATLPSPAAFVACRSPSSYLQRYQKPSVKGSFSLVGRPLRRRGAACHRARPVARHHLLKGRIRFLQRRPVPSANRQSREVAAFPAAGSVNTPALTDAQVPLFKTSFIKLVTRYATRGSSTAWVAGVTFSSTVPLALTTPRKICGSARTPPCPNAV